MGDRKRRNEEYEFQAPTSRAVNGNKRGRATPKASARSPSRSTSGSSSSSCADDSVGHMNAVRGDVLMGRYNVEYELGTGTFGKVFLCHDRKHDQKVAVKVVRSIKRYVESALIEGSVLDAVYSRQKKERTDFCVKMYSHFNLNDHYCLVFETLGISIYDLIKRNDYIGFPLHYVKDLSRQLLGSMDFLESMKLIHTGATFDSEHKSTIVNTRQYRGPEVTLEAGWSFPSDIWSVGCMISEIYSGELFFQVMHRIESDCGVDKDVEQFVMYVRYSYFQSLERKWCPTHDDAEHIALMERCIGPFPSSLIDRSKRARDYFQRNGRVRLDPLSSDSRVHVSNALTIREFFSLNPGDSSSGILEFMTALLELDPNKRATASQALRMPFLSESSSERDRERERERDRDKERGCVDGRRNEFDRSSSIRTDKELSYDQRRRGSDVRGNVNGNVNGNGSGSTGQGGYEDVRRLESRREDDTKFDERKKKEREKDGEKERERERERERGREREKGRGRTERGRGGAGEREMINRGPVTNTEKNESYNASIQNYNIQNNSDARQGRGPSSADRSNRHHHSRTFNNNEIHSDKFHSNRDHIANNGGHGNGNGSGNGNNNYTGNSSSNGQNSSSGNGTGYNITNDNYSSESHKSHYTNTNSNNDVRQDSSNVKNTYVPTGNGDGGRRRNVDESGNVSGRDFNVKALHHHHANNADNKDKDGDGERDAHMYRDDTGNNNRDTGNNNRDTGNNNRDTGNNNRDTGNNNTGNRGAGNRDTGNNNRDTGNNNTGNRDTGNRDTGNNNRDTGNNNHDTGNNNRDTGNNNRDTGNNNTGNRDTGNNNRDTGNNNRDTGNNNTSNRDTSNREHALDNTIHRNRGHTEHQNSRNSDRYTSNGHTDNSKSTTISRNGENRNGENRMNEKGAHTSRHGFRV